jgi:hypothetical protein
MQLPQQDHPAAADQERLDHLFEGSGRSTRPVISCGCCTCCWGHAADGVLEAEVDGDRTIPMRTGRMMQVLVGAAAEGM